MAIVKRVLVGASGLALAGVTLAAGPTASAGTADSTCAGAVTAVPRALPSGCTWKCTKQSHGTCTKMRRVCTGGGGGGGGSHGGGGGGGGSASNTNNISINNSNTNTSQSSNREPRH